MEGRQKGRRHHPPPPFNVRQSCQWPHPPHALPPVGHRGAGQGDKQPPQHKQPATLYP